jgi:hypothetical protein
VRDPEAGPGVEEREVRALHPDIPDEEWSLLMAAAERRSCENHPVGWRVTNDRRDTAVFDPDTWYGDTDTLPLRGNDCWHDEDFCEETFYSKREAFWAGLALAQRPEAAFESAPSGGG